MHSQKAHGESFFAVDRPSWSLHRLDYPVSWDSPPLPLLLYACIYTGRRLKNVSRESKILIGILVLVVGGMIGLFMLTNTGSEPPTGETVDRAALVRSDSHKAGNGAVELVEFGDYQCPACANAHPYVNKILKDYEGKITFVFRNFPLTNSHPHALASANAAEAAAAQGKFWQMHDKLYESQKEWSPLAASAVGDKFAEYAKALGLDGDKVKLAVADQAYKQLIDRDLADGATVNVSATPTFYVDGRKVTGSGEEGLRDAIDAALAVKK
jgi:protein-disulfide isomerase